MALAPSRVKQEASCGESGLRTRAATSIGSEDWAHLEAYDDDETLIFERPSFMGIPIPPYDARKPLPARGPIAGCSDKTQPSRRLR